MTATYGPEPLVSQARGATSFSRPMVAMAAVQSATRWAGQRLNNYALSEGFLSTFLAVGSRQQLAGSN